MRTLNVAAAAVNQTPLDWDGNRARLLAVLDDARAARVAVLCLPEMCITGYGCEDAFHARHVVDTAWSELAALLPATRGMVVSFGLPVRHRNGLFNGAVLVVDGTIAGIVCKRHLAGDGVHYEPRWFKPWPPDVRSAATLPIDTPAAIPIGDIHFDIGGVRIGFEICEDAWVATRPGGELARRGVDIILNPSASHFAFGKHEIRQRFVVEGSRAFGVTYVYANLLGNEAGRVIYDGGALIASGGEMVARGRRFSFRDHELVTAVVDLDRDRTTQVRTASFQPDVVDRGDTVSVDFTLPSQELADGAVLAAPDAWEIGNAVKEEEFTRAVALGLWDYLRKSGATGFVLSLSGGADSSACATLVQVATRLAAGDLGEDWARRLPKAPEGAALDRDVPLTGRLLCLYQRTAQSSATTEASARTVAQGAGAAFHVVDIDAMVVAYRGIAEEVCGRQMSWTGDAIALQNVQARARAPGVWIIANLRALGRPWSGSPRDLTGTTVEGHRLRPHGWKDARDRTPKGASRVGTQSHVSAWAGDPWVVDGFGAVAGGRVYVAREQTVTAYDWATEAAIWTRTDLGPGTLRTFDGFPVWASDHWQVLDPARGKTPTA